MSKETSTVLTIKAGTFTTARNGTESTTFWTCVSPPPSEPPLMDVVMGLVAPVMLAVMVQPLGRAPVPGEAVMVTVGPAAEAVYLGDEERRLICAATAAAVSAAF